jgi:hypothetical protein
MREYVANEAVPVKHLQLSTLRQPSATGAAATYKLHAR